ncbi:MAG: class I SAM-dependent methyltransferase [Candidatus Latescibacterota bacterium]|nr:MAG: class I SAM-dependent methyltransferase [Candidatus Latescibacterota bacterium]
MGRPGCGQGGGGAAHAGRYASGAANTGGTAAEATRGRHMMHDGEMTDAYFSYLVEKGIASSLGAVTMQLTDLFDGIELRGARMLDIGGGNGVYSFYASCMGADEVICMEPAAAGSSSEAKADFESLSSRLPGARVRLDTRTVQEFRKEDGLFDVILMQHSINHLDEPACVTLLDDPNSRMRYREGLSVVSGLAKPGAALIVSDCSRHNFFALLKLKNPIAPFIEWHKHHAPEVWVELLEETGFRDPKITWEPIYRFGSIGKMFLANRAAAFFLKSVFRLKMTKGQ